MTIFCPTSSRGWQATLPPSLPSLYKTWLLRPGALTAGLRGLGPVRLRVLREHAGGVPVDEAQAMGLAPGTPVWLREIVMSVDGVDCVAARSLAPLPASHGVWKGMRRLRTRPLADMLYHDRSVRRSAFACVRIRPAIALYAVVRRVLPEAPPGGPWARRSVFWRGGQPLLVAECFLPAFWTLAAAAFERIGPGKPVAGNEHTSTSRAL
ncbi:chorismate lyase [Pigmentiphaga soli]|uniref:Probable chorismate pyruvate-lyase n=1 Tax=Pigmentiphaga soli TaxID=1007095 RepID=A0ABP8GLQ5_9BURK